MGKRNINDLSAPQRLFIEEYLRTGNLSRSAKAAGYSGNTTALSKVGKKLLENPKIMLEIERHQRTAANRAAYGLKEAMDEAESLKQLAIEHKQMGAAIRAIEHKAKLNGLLVEKHEVAAGFSIRISGIDDQRQVAEATQTLDISRLIGPKKDE